MCEQATHIIISRVIWWLCLFPRPDCHAATAVAVSASYSISGPLVSGCTLWVWQAGDQKAGVLASLNIQLSQLTGEGEDLAACTKSYRQCIFKLNHKMNKLSGQVSNAS